MMKTAALNSEASQVETRKLLCLTLQMYQTRGSIARPKTRKLDLGHILTRDGETNSDLLRALDDFGSMEDDQIGFLGVSAPASGPFDFLDGTHVLPISFRRLLPHHSKSLCQQPCTILLHPVDASGCTVCGDENSNSRRKSSFLAPPLE